MDLCRLKVETGAWIGNHHRLVPMQEQQSTKMWTCASVCESRLPLDACNLQHFTSAITDAVKESLLVKDSLSALGVVLGGVAPKDKSGSIVSHSDSGALYVTASVECSCCETVDAGFVEQVKSDVTEERQQLFLLVFGQAGRDH